MGLVTSRHHSNCGFIFFTNKNKKSVRVVSQEKGERNFHIFYQLLSTPDIHLLKYLKLQRNVAEYAVLGGWQPVAEDRAAFGATRRALDALGLSTAEVLSVVAAVLRLGNLRFVPQASLDGSESCGLANEYGRSSRASPRHDLTAPWLAELHEACELLAGDPSVLLSVLTQRTLESHGNLIVAELTAAEANYARDALCKSLYSRLFTWIVSKINDVLKVRVVSQEKGERNFHIFYQLLSTPDIHLLKYLKLQRNVAEYAVLGGWQPVAEDRAAFGATRRALDALGLSTAEVLSVVAAVLRLGNLRFVPQASLDGSESCGLANEYGRSARASPRHDLTAPWLAELHEACELLAGDPSVLLSVLTQRTLESHGNLIVAELTAAENNGFEQFIINYCNEKLHQMFVELTLKDEQEEYIREGIEWEPIEYFNNSAICELIERNNHGILAVLDEESLRSGPVSDDTFLHKVARACQDSPYFEYPGASRKFLPDSPPLPNHCFRLRHFAGPVTYSVHGFLEKNNDLLYKEVSRAMYACCDHPLLKVLFPEGNPCRTTVKRPATTATQFKTSISALMKNLQSRHPNYVRCIKPNELKQPVIFETALVLHQVRYSGLLEHVQIRRAGYVHRETYDAFLRRYKLVSPTTWPCWSGLPEEGVARLLHDLSLHPSEFAFGRTKIFVRSPSTVTEWMVNMASGERSSDLLRPVMLSLRAVGVHVPPGAAATGRPQRRYSMFWALLVMVYRVVYLALGWLYLFLRWIAMVLVLDNVAPESQFEVLFFGVTSPVRDSYAIGLYVLVAFFWTLEIIFVHGTLVFVPVLFMSLCLLLSRAYHEHNLYIKDMSAQPTEPRRLDVVRIRSSHERLCLLVYGVDHIFGKIIFFWYLILLISVCFDITQLFTDETLLRNKAKDDVFFFSLRIVYSVLTFLGTCVAASSVSHEAHASVPAVHALTLRGSTTGSELGVEVKMEAQLLLARLASPPVGLSGWNFFTINRSFILSVTAALTTYVVIVIQMNPKAMRVIHHLVAQTVNNATTHSSNSTAMAANHTQD
ncbi:MYO1A [Cordylochernes scorpioides]|uniref:MYO1A n=1 Tax=Cordylochernes scorpioides TaxID=51811 RepID=A0ABY6KJU0_9ARAC|nr:MYO1A [Cordylochernes scorpioides]